MERTRTSQLALGIGRREGHAKTVCDVTSVTVPVPDSPAVGVRLFLIFSVIR